MADIRSLPGTDIWSWSKEKIGCFDCTEVEYRDFWRHYFDIETDYGALMAQINPNDTYLTANCSVGMGCKNPESGFVGDDCYVPYFPAK